jgi:hypothetical protein
MHFAALVALAVVGSSILGLAAPVPNSCVSIKQPPSRPTECISSHPQLEVTSKRDDDDFALYYPSSSVILPVQRAEYDQY